MEACSAEGEEEVDVWMSEIGGSEVGSCFSAEAGGDETEWEDREDACAMAVGEGMG